MIEEILHLAWCKDESNHLIKQVLAQLTVDEIAWISQNRDWAEATRYELKEEVDSNLLASDTVTLHRKIIEDIFYNSNKEMPELSYLNILQTDLAAMHKVLQGILILEYTKAWTLEMITTSWRCFARLADIDNAHAMYLSSGNWEFSIFNRLIDRIQTLPVDDDVRDILLIGGVLDVRTSIYDLEVLKKMSAPADRQQFAAQVKELPVAITSNGVMPIFLYQAASTPLPTRLTDLKNQFIDTVESFCIQFPRAEKNKTVRDLLMYRDLQRARVVYDTYEYFGFYAFVRHLLILRTMEIISPLNYQLAARIHHAASLYEYRLIPDLIQSIPNRIQEKEYEEIYMSKM